MNSTDNLSCFLTKATKKNPTVSLLKSNQTWYVGDTLQEHIMWENKINIYPGKRKQAWGFDILGRQTELYSH